MNYIIDAVLIVTIGIVAFIGFRKGFVQMAMTVVGLVAAFIVAFTFSTPAANWFYDALIADKMSVSVDTAMEGYTSNTIDGAIDKLFSSGEMVERLAKMSGTTKEKIKESLDGLSLDEVAKRIKTDVVRPPLVFLLRAVIMLIMLIILVFLVQLLAKLIGKAFSLSVIGGVNRLLGCVSGVVLGVLFAFVLCMFLDTALAIFPDGFIGITPKTRDSSYVYNFIFNLTDWKI